MIRLCQVMACHESIVGNRSVYKGELYGNITWSNYLREELEWNHMIYSNENVYEHLMLYKAGYKHEWAIIKVISIW